ncbi:MAG: HAMP domain-containing histidine kinase [Lachnospiraceae bacterium]|nr:HAMP domain-containing histidine kinase [Lachnospiraceae bacterium]
MSSSRNNAYAWLLLAAAAMLIAAGLRIAQGRELFSDPVETTLPPATTAVFVWETNTAAEDMSGADGAEEETAYSAVIASDGGSSAASPWRPIAGSLCILAGMAAAAAALIRFPQSAPILGPDGSLLLLALAAFRRLYGRAAVIGLALFVFVCLLFLSEWTGWIRKRLRPAWFLVARAALGLAQKVYGRDLRHLEEQLERFGEGENVEPGDGAYAGLEEKLREIQKENAQAMQDAVTSERFKVELISNVSHDLRTPLTAILGYGELLQEETLSKKGEEQLERLNRKAAYMKDLVDDLFELTKVSSGALEPALSGADLVKLLEQTVGLYQEELDEAGLTVKRTYFADRIPVWTDGARMHQVFANLLENACKYALRGSRIYIYAEEAGPDIRVRVVNTASYEMDFSPEEIVRRFARGDKARSSQGSGLGLAIAQTYTESVGGRFEVKIDGDQFNALVYLPRETGKQGGTEL